jgi:aminopeptidase N
VLEEYKNNLLKKEDDGRTIESAGPITMGHRLYSSLSPASWSLVTYEKGSWILHMIRRRMGDERFSKMLSALYSRNMHQAITTEQFRATAREFLPPGSVDPKLDEFFEHWVHGTGIPSLKLSWTTTGKAPRVKLTGTITQSDVDEDFSIWTPVEIHLPRRKPLIKWVRTNSDAEKFEVTLPAAPVRVVLDPGNATLARK